MAELKRLSKEEVGNDKPIWTVDIHLTMDRAEALNLALALDNLGYDEEAADIREEVEPKVTCSVCHKPTLAETAHLYQDELIGDCCWDDRLKSSE